LADITLTLTFKLYHPIRSLDVGQVLPEADRALSPLAPLNHFFGGLLF